MDTILIIVITIASIIVLLLSCLCLIFLVRRSTRIRLPPGYEYFCDDASHSYQNITSGNRAFQQMEYEQALMRYKNEIWFSEDKPDCYCNIGYSLLKLHREEEAIDAFNQAILEDEKFYKAYFGKGITFMNFQRHKDAIDPFNKALSIKPNLFEAFCGKTKCLLLLKRYNEAILACDSLLKTNSNSFEAFYYKGYALAQLKRFREALGFYDRAISLRNVDKRITLFANIRKRRRSSASLSSTDSISSLPHKDVVSWLMPKLWDMHFEKGNVLYNLKRYGLAKTSYTESIELQQYRYESYFRQGIALKALGKYENAIESFGNSIQLNANVDAWNNKGFANECLGNFDEALKCYNQALKILPTTSNARNNKNKLIEFIEVTERHRFPNSGSLNYFTYDFIISYSIEFDKEKANNLLELFTSNGFKCWMQTPNQSGHLLDDTLVEVILSSKLVLLCITTNFLESDDCLREFNLIKKFKHKNLIIPVLCENKEQFGDWPPDHFIFNEADNTLDADEPEFNYLPLVTNEHKRFISKVNDLL